MHSPLEVRRRIRSIGATAQITRAMQMVAASKMRKAQEAAINGRPFAQLLYRIQRAASTQAGDIEHPLQEVRAIRQRAVILIGADKGLCGALNSNLFRAAQQFDAESTVFVAAGRRAGQFVSRSGRRLAAEFTYGDSPTFAESRAIAKVACDLFLTGQVDEVKIVFTRFVNTLKQDPISIEFLPVGEIKGVAVPGAEPEDTLKAEPQECVFEPSAKAVLGYLLSHYLNLVVYQVLLNAKASEQSARMVSMKNATESADALIKDLMLEYNKMRQGNITRELLEIAGGQAE